MAHKHPCAVCGHPSVLCDCPEPTKTESCHLRSPGGRGAKCLTLPAEHYADVRAMFNLTGNITAAQRAESEVMQMRARGQDCQAHVYAGLAGSRTVEPAVPEVWPPQPWPLRYGFVALVVK